MFFAIKTLIYYAPSYVQSPVKSSSSCYSLYFLIARNIKIKLCKVQLVPKGMKPMASRFPKPERTFRILLTLFHSIETVCKVVALLISNLEYSKDTRSGDSISMRSNRLCEGN